MSNPASSPRRVALASAVGATIEWYDFFLYGTAAGLVFDKLFFNGLDGPAAQFACVRHVRGRLPRPAGGRADLRPLRRPDRPQDDADLDAGHHGRRHGPDRPAADVRRDRRLGAGAARRAPGPPGHRRGRRVRRRGAAGGRVRARGAARLLRQLRPHRRARRAVPGLRRVRPRQPAARRGLPRLGLACVLPGQRAAAGDRRVDPAEHHGDPGLPAGAGREGDLRRPGDRALPSPAARPAAGHGHPLHRGLHVQPVLRVPPRLRRQRGRRGQVDGPQRDHGRRAARRRRSSWWPGGCPTPSAASRSTRSARCSAWSSRSPRRGSCRRGPPSASWRRSSAGSASSTAGSTDRSRRSGASCSTPATGTPP